MRRKFHITICLVAVLAALSGCNRRFDSGARLNPGQDTKIATILGTGDHSGKNDAHHPYITFVSPRGEAQAPAQIIIVFDRHMVALGETRELVVNPGITITPSANGTFQWLSPDTLAFTPSSRFKRATSYSVHVPAGLKSADGKSTIKPYDWKFTTEQPKVLSVTSNNEGSLDALDVKPVFYVTFNQPVPLDEVRKNISIETRTGNTVKYPALVWRKSVPGTPPDTSVAVSLQSPLPKSTDFKIVISSNLKGREGDIQMAEDSVTFFSTYRDFAVTADNSSSTCDRAPSLTFSNPVRYRDFVKSVSISPQVPVYEDYSNTTYSSTTLTYPGGSFKPGKYTVTANPSLRDIFGQRLANTYSFEFGCPDNDPILDLTNSFSVLEADGPHLYPVKTMNLESIRLRIRFLSESDIVPAFNTQYREDDSEKPDDLSYDHDESVVINNIPNQLMLSVAPLDKAAPKTKRGVFYLRATSDKKESCNSDTTIDYSSIIQLTNIGLIAKTSGKSTLVWATSLKDGAPVSNAKITIRDRDNNRLWSGITNSDGVATAPGSIDLISEKYRKKRGSQLYIIARKGDDTAVLSSSWSYGIDSYYFDLPYGNYIAEPGLYGHIFTERDIYRPGDTIRIKAIVRHDEYGKFSIAKTKQVAISIYNNENNEVFHKEGELSAYGTIAASWRVPLGARLGSYSIRILSDGKTIEGPATYVDVQEYRTPDFEVKLKTPAKSYTFGDRLSATATSRYLYGEPMRQAKVEWAVRQYNDYYHSERFNNYEFNDWISEESNESGADTSEGTLFSDTLKTNSAGLSSISMPLRAGPRPGARHLTIEATTSDVNRQTISETTSVTVHPGLFYIGLKPASYYFKPGSRQSISVIAISPDDKIYKTGTSVTLHAFKRDWHTSLKKQLHGGWYYDSRPVDTPAGRCSTRTSSKPATCSFTISKPGYYYVRASARDPRGNTIYSSTDFYAISPDAEIGWLREDSPRIELKADKKSYKPGDTATILVKSPYKKARALVTIERERLFEYKYVTLTGSAPSVKIPVKSGYAPNMSVSVILVQGRTSTRRDPQKGDVGKPSFKVGYTSFEIRAETKRLSVKTASTAKSYKPGANATLTVKTSDATGKPVRGEVALMVVDEGVLNLTGFTTPDPFAAFYAPRDTNVQTSSSYLHIIDRRDYGKKGYNPGGGGKGAGNDARIREIFKSCAYWNPSLITDSHGNARVTFKLPDNTTRYRVMAVAVTKGDRFGSAQATFTVSKPLLARPSLPRFAHVGDHFEGGVVIANNTKKSRSVTISAKSEGINIKSKHVTRNITVPAGASREVTFSYSAPAQGTATFDYTITSGKLKDAIRTRIPVKNSKPLFTEAVHGSVTTKAVERIKFPANADTHEGGLSLILAPTALTGLENAARAVEIYPYDCAEQTLSKGVAALSLMASGKSGKASTENIRATVEKIPLFQKESGGIAYWQDSDCESPYLSAYALIFINEAAAHGIKADTRSKAALKKYLENIVREKIKPSCGYKSYTDYEKVAAVYALAGAGKEMNSYHVTLFDRRKDLPVWAKAMLAAAIKMTDGDIDLVGRLLREVANNVVMSGGSTYIKSSTNQRDSYTSPLYSNTWATAVTLIAFLEADRSNKLVPGIVRYLVSDMKADGWANTHEAAFSLLALSKYYRLFEKTSPDFTAKATYGLFPLSTHRFTSSADKSVTIELPAKKLKKGTEKKLTITRRGHGILYYTAILRYAPAKWDGAPENRGFVVDTEYRTPGGARIGNTITAGQVIKITASIIATGDRHFVVVEDKLPAGFELINQRFKTSKHHASSYDTEGTDPAALPKSDMYNWWVFNNVEMKDDRVALFADHMPSGVYRYTYYARATTSGKFTDPAATATEMYSPQVTGRGRTKTFRIR